MAQERLIDSLAELLSMPERWVIQDEENQIHELSDGIKGKPVILSAKSELYHLYFQKERISIEDFKFFEKTHSEMIAFIWSNFSHKVKTDSQEELSDIIEKYGLKKVKTREKRKK